MSKETLTYEATHLTDETRVDLHAGREDLLPPEQARNNAEEAQAAHQQKLERLKGQETPAAHVARVGLQLMKHRIAATEEQNTKANHDLVG